MKTPTFAQLGTLAAQTAPYALIVTGNALAPTFTDGQRIAIMPQVSADPATLKAGSVVLAAIALIAEQLDETDAPTTYHAPGLWKLNADRDLLCGTRTIECGKYLILGTAHAAL